MKKILFLAIALVVSVCGAWADPVYPEAGKTYKMHCLAVSGHTAAQYVSITNEVITHNSATGSNFIFEDAGENKWYIKDAGSNKYLYVANATAGTNITLSAEATTYWTAGGPFHTNGIRLYPNGNTSCWMNNNNAFALKTGEGECSSWVLEEVTVNKDWVVVTSIAPSTNVANPEHVYTLTSCNDASYKWSSLTHPVTEGEGSFAFYSVADKNDTYRIYSINEGKWLTYNKANSNTNMQSFITVDEETQDNAGYFKVTYVTGSGGANGVSGFIMAPYSASDAATGKYLNWNGGIAGCIGKTLGLWQDGNTDKGSIWTVKELQEVEPYPYNFTNVNIPNAARKIMSATIGGVTVDFSDNNSKCYNDNTTKTFRIEKTDQPLTTKFTLNGGSWIHGYLYIDLNKDKQFTVSNPVELVTKTTNQSTSPDLAQTGSWATFACPEIGTYRMRLKTDWADTNPGGSSSFTTSQTSGQIIDVILEVVAPTNKVDVTYDLNVNGTKIGEKVITETIGNMPTIADWMNTLSSRDYVILNSMHNEAITAESGNAHVQVNTTYNSNLPFTPDGTTLYNLSLNREPALVIYAEGEGISTKATSNASYVAPTYANQNNYKWSFGGDWFNGFTIKNAGTQKYVSYGSNNPNDNTHATFVESTEGEGCHFEFRLNNGKKYFRIQGSTNEAYISNNGGATTTYLTNWNSSNNFNGNGDAGAQFLIVADAINPSAIDWTLFETALNSVKAYTIGTGLGEYSCTINSVAVNASQMNFYKDAWQGTLDDQTEANYATHMNEINEALESMQINQPEAGRFLVIQGTTGGKYMNGRELTTEKSVMWYGEDNKLLAFTTGLGFTGTSQNATVEQEANTQTFAEAQTVGTYFIVSDATGVGQYMYENTNNVDRYNTNAHDRKRWNVSYATSLPVTFKAAGQGYATIYSPVALEIPTGIIAYYGTEESEDAVKVSPIADGIIPANTAVVLFKEGVTETTTVDFTITTGGTATSCFTGTVAAKVAGADKYVFSIVGGQAGFYKFGGTTLAGFKAYIESNVETQGFVINFGGLTTGINNVNANVNANHSFDLQGRRVSKATRGLFIQNGVKVIR